MSYAVKVDHLSKKFRKGQTSYRTLREDLYDLTGRLIHLRKHKEEADAHHIWALRDVTFEIQPGERVGIIGRNGSGKTTLLRLLSGITQPTLGKVWVRGRLGVIIELMAGFHPELTGRENVYLNGAIMGMSQKEIRRKFDEIVSFAEVEQWIDTPIKRYSSGMHVRLGFAIAAHLDPDVLLVDEVLAVGDTAFQKKCLDKMGEVAGEGRTIVFVSHSMPAVASLCDRCILLETGRVAADGPTNEAIQRYLQTSHAEQPEAESPDRDLTARENPCMPGHRILRRVRLLNTDGVPQSAFLMRQGMVIAIDVEGLSDYEDAAVGVIFKTENEQRIAAINTNMTCSHVQEPRQKAELASLQIEQLVFMPATYWIDLSVTCRRSGRVERIDFANRAARLTVLEADIYGSKCSFSGDYGLVCLDAAWEIVHR